MATGSATLTATATGLVTGSLTFGPATITLGSAVGEVLLVSLASGANTITVPGGSTFVVIAPPPTNTATLQLKGVSGDTGIPLSLTSPTLLAVNAASTFVITTNGATSATLWFF